MWPIWFDLVIFTEEILMENFIFYAVRAKFSSTTKSSPHQNILFTQYFMHYRISSNKMLFAIFSFPMFTMLLFFLFSKCKGRFLPFFSWNFNAPFIVFSQLPKHINRYDYFLEIQRKVEICQNEPRLEKKKNKCSEKIHFKLQQISEKRLSFLSFYTYIVLFSSV